MTRFYTLGVSKKDGHLRLYDLGLHEDFDAANELAESENNCKAYSSIWILDEESMQSLAMDFHSP